MKTKDIKGMASAYMQVLGLTEKKKMDPVDKDELKGDLKDREDKDIDNDGKVDKSDEYLHKRRKAISKNVKQDSEEMTSEAADAKWMVTHKKEQGTTGKYIDSTQFHPDERSARAHKGKLKHTPGVLKGSISMKKVKPEDMSKEDAQWTVYNRILEKRDMHTKGATAPETMDDKFKGKGAKDAKNDIENGANWDDTAKKGMDDVAAAGRAGPSKKSRPGDNTAGDNNIINKPEDVTKKGGAQ